MKFQKVREIVEAIQIPRDSMDIEFQRWLAEHDHDFELAVLDRGFVVVEYKGTQYYTGDWIVCKDERLEIIPQRLFNLLYEEVPNENCMS